MSELKCKDLMVGDWIADEHGFPMRVVAVGEDWCNADFDGNDGDVWEFNDKDEQPRAIELTAEIVKKNNFSFEDHEDFGVWKIPGKGNANFILLHCAGFDISFAEGHLHINYVHELQHALRLCGLNELADLAKI